MKKTAFAVTLAIGSSTAYAQFESLFQSVKQQIADSVQQPITHGVHAATDAAVKSATGTMEQAISASGASAVHAR